ARPLQEARYRQGRVRRAHARQPIARQRLMRAQHFRELPSCLEGEPARRHGGTHVAKKDSSKINKADAKSDAKSDAKAKKPETSKTAKKPESSRAKKPAPAPTPDPDSEEEMVAIDDPAADLLDNAVKSTPWWAMSLAFHGVVLAALPLIV